MVTLLMLLVVGAAFASIVRRLVGRMEAVEKNAARLYERVADLEARLGQGAAARPSAPADTTAAPGAEPAPAKPVVATPPLAAFPPAAAAPPVAPSPPIPPPAAVPPAPPIPPPAVSRPSVAPPPPVASRPPVAPPPVVPPPRPDAKAAPVGPGLEERIGAVWLTRLGLVLLAIGVAYFANLAYAYLQPWQKTAIAYSGALALFGVGRYFERSLERFARPVMIGGLALAYFVSYAAHFVPAMRCASLPVALAWMTGGIGAIFLLADRWRSQPAAGFAVFLGHTAAFVAATQGDVWAPTGIALLAALAVALHVRHDWPPFSLFALGISYVGHVAWLVLAHAGPRLELLPRELALNVGFLTSYYVIFCASDLLWWARRRDGSAATELDARLARAVGPTNVLLYVSLAVFCRTLTPHSSGWHHVFFFTLAAVQLVMGRLHRRYGNPDHVLYPALAAVFATAGFATWLDALALNQVLALEALVLLLVAHRTRVWAFHLLAQAALVLNFLHYWFIRPPAPPLLPDFVGAILVVAVYLVKSQLEELWYAGGQRREWTDAPAGPLLAPVARAFDSVFGYVAPHLAGAHAVAGAVMLVRESSRYFELPGGVHFLGATIVLLAAAAAVRGSSALRGAHFVVQAGLALAASMPVLAPDVAALALPPWTAWLGAAAAWTGVAVVAVRGGRANADVTLIAHGELLAAIATTWFLATHLPTGALLPYLAWTALACVPAALHGRARDESLKGALLVAAFLAAGPFLWTITNRHATGPAEAMWWLRLWCVALVGAGLGTRRIALVAAGVAALAGEATIVARLLSDLVTAHRPFTRDIVWWMPLFDWAVALAILEGGARRLPGETRTSVVGQVAVVVGLLSAGVALVYTPPLAGSTAALWLAVLVLGFVVQDRAAVGRDADRDVVLLSSVLGALLALLALQWFDVATYRGLALVSASAALGAAAGVRRHRGFAVASGLVFLVGHASIHPLRTGGTGTPLATFAIVVLSIAIGLAVDRAGRRRDGTTSTRVAASAAIAYLCAFFVAVPFAEHSVPAPWEVPLIGALAPLLLLLGRRLSAPVATFASLALLAHVALARVLPGLDRVDVDPLVPLLAFAGVGLVWERVAAREGLADASAAASGLFARRARASVVAGALAVGFVAVGLSSTSGPDHEWLTVGWSVLAALFLGLGFALASADHRRVGLAGLGVCLLRVFLVDTRTMTDFTKTLTFVGLALCLLAGGWLYARFASRIREWL